MRQPDGPTLPRQFRSARVLGWIVAAHAVGLALAVTANAAAAGDAAHQIALWCGIG